MPLVVMEDRSGSGLDGRAQGRLAAIQDNVRAALLDIGTPSSSVYSRSPNVQQSPEVRPSPPLPTTPGTTKPPMVRSLFGLVPRAGNTPELRHMPTFPSPFRRRRETTGYSPATQPSEWGQPQPPAQPSPIAQPEFRHPADTVPVMNHEPDLEAALPPRPKKHRRKHKRRADGAWRRNRKMQAGSRTCSACFQGPTRTKAIATVVSGTFLITVLTMCMSTCASRKSDTQYSDDICEQISR
jgi:hypothetical protein